MAYNLGWQRIYHGDPFVRATIWVDELWRVGNRVHFTLNASLAVEKVNGFWDFPWFVDIQLGNNVWDGRMIKGSTAWRQVIGGREFYLHERNGHFRGYVDVSGQEQHLVVRLYFRDQKGNTGVNCYYAMNIPRATNPSPMSMEVLDLGTSTATLKGSIAYRGEYSTIKKWRLQYKTNDKDEVQLDFDNEDVLTKTWQIQNLKPATRYMYRISALTSSGYWTYRDAVLITKPAYIGSKVDSEETKKLSAYIIYPDGNVKRVTKIREVK